MLNYVKKKKNVFHRTDGQKDRRTDGRSTQNCSSEPHKNFSKNEKEFFFQIIFLQIPKEVEKIILHNYIKFDINLFFRINLFI